MQKESEEYKMYMKWPTIKVFCCREWIIFAGVPCGRCGDCGERPMRRV